MSVFLHSNRHCERSYRHCDGAFSAPEAISSIASLFYFLFLLPSTVYRPPTVFIRIFVTHSLFVDVSHFAHKDTITHPKNSIGNITHCFFPYGFVMLLCSTMQSSPLSSCQCLWARLLALYLQKDFPLYKNLYHQSPVVPLLI